jgi:hypothetical protein
MILQELTHFIKEADRVEEGVLLKHFHLTQSSLTPMISVLLKRGNIQKTVNARGDNLPASIYYSYHNKASIPVMTMI